MSPSLSAILRIALVGVTLALSFPENGLASCDVIPSAINDFPSGLGSTNTPFAAPDQLVQIRVRPQVCDAESPGFTSASGTSCVSASDLRATFVFFDRSPSPALPTAIVLARNCGSPTDPASAAYAAARLTGVARAECRSVGASALDVVAVPVTGGNECRLNVRLPATPDSAISPDFTLTGPARIAVDRAGGALPANLASARCAALAGTGPLACIDELYKLNGTCETDAAAQREVFSHFVALPRANVYRDMIQEDASQRPAARFALDDRGNVLANVDWSGVLADGLSEAFPPPQLVNFFASIGSGLDAAGRPSVPGVPLQVVEDAAFTSYSPLGIQLPPLFEPSSDSTQTLTLFGSADAVASVVRVQRGAGHCAASGLPCITDAACGGEVCDTSTLRPTFDLAYCISAAGCLAPDATPGPVATAASGPGGPGAIRPSDYSAQIDGFVPLENLNVCRNTSDLTCLLRDETLPVSFSDSGVPSGSLQCEIDPDPSDELVPVCRDRNADGDAFDTALTLRDAKAGARLALPPTDAEGVAVATLYEAVSPDGPFPFPLSGRSTRNAVVAGETAAGSCVATLLAEPDEGEGDENVDGESYDPLLRVYCPDATGALVQKAIDPLGNAEKLAVVAKPSVLPPGRTLSPLQPGLEPLVIDNGKAVFFLDEPGNARQLTARADVADVSLGGAPANAASRSPALDASGGVVCFESNAQNLVGSADKNKIGFDVFCHDFANGETFVVNRFQEPPTRLPLCSGRIIRANDAAAAPSVAGDGARARVCYESSATNLIKNDGNRASDVFLLDRCSCDMVLLSRRNDGTQLPTASGSCDLNGAGDLAVFASGGRVYSQRVIGSSPATCGVGPVETDRLRAGGLVDVSAGVPGTAGAPTVSADGRVIAFELSAGGTTSVYVAETGRPTVCVDADGTPGCDLARAPKLSADGRLLTYAAPPANSFVLDRVTGLAEPIGGAADALDGRAETPAVAFTSRTGAIQDAVLQDRVTGLAKFVDPISGSSQPALTPDGRTVAWTRGGAVFRSMPDRLDARADASGDGLATTSVLAVLDLETGALERLGPAQQAAAGGGAIAFLDPTGRVFVRGLSGPLTLAGTPAIASAVAASEAAVCILTRATGALACAPANSTSLVDFGLTADGLALEGDVVAVLGKPASPRTLQLIRTSDRRVLASASGVRRFRMAENQFVAVDQCEADLGVVLNDDGDRTDCLALILGPDGRAYDTSDPIQGLPRHTIRPCTGDICDDTDPFKIFPFGSEGTLAKLRHLSEESDEPALFGDLNGDGVVGGVVVREVVAGANVAFPPISVPEGSTGNVLAGTETGPGQSQAGAAIPAQVGFCDADGDGTADTQNACQSDANCIAQGTCGGTPCCVDVQPRVLALADTDGDGVYDVYDNCPTVFNPEQDASDGDGDGTPDACDESATCGDGVVTRPEYCDYADATIDPTTGRTLGSFCNGPAQAGTDCTPIVAVAVSEAAVNPGKEGILPTTIFGSPILNLGTAERNGWPAKMIEPDSFVLEALRPNEACGGIGAAPIDDVTSPTGYTTRLTDRNGDGFIDLALRFEVLDMAIQSTDTQACLRGTFHTFGGRFFEAGFETRDGLNVK
jgi:hypothetical protein